MVVDLEILSQWFAGAVPWDRWRLGQQLTMYSVMSSSLV